MRRKWLLAGNCRCCCWAHTAPVPWHLQVCLCVSEVPMCQRSSPKVSRHSHWVIAHLREQLCSAPADSTCFFFASFASFSRTCSLDSQRCPFALTSSANTICLVMWPMVAVNCTVAHNHNGKWPINSAVCLCVHVFQNAHYVAKKNWTAKHCWNLSDQQCAGVRLRHTQCT